MICDDQPQTYIKNIYIVCDELRYQKDLSRKSLAVFGCSRKNCPVYCAQIRRLEWIFLQSQNSASTFHMRSYRPKGMSRGRERYSGHRRMSIP